MVINGEKQKDVIPGATVAFHTLHKPKTNPKTAPYFQPIVIAAMITGICIKVADKGPIRKKPNGVNNNTNSTARKKANKVKCFVF